jgi:hypothetical protein
MISLSPAERVLWELGVTDPREIDLEAIAWHLGAQVKRCDLDGCEARIIGRRDRAIIRVNRLSHPRRQRFSIGHELGHWRHHRGRMLVCRSDDIGTHRPGTPEIERVADIYAADLLLPHYLFVPIARQHATQSFRTVRELSDLFDTSITATAIRLVESKHSLAVLICHGPHGRKWFTRSPDVPERWFPRNELDPESFAFDLLFGQGGEQIHPRLIGADAWFDRDEARRYELREHSVRTADDEILTLLMITDEGMLEDWGYSSDRRGW